MTKKILVLTMSQQQSNFEVTRLVEEAQKLGIEVNRALYRDLSFKLDNGETKVLIKDEEVTPENTLAVWFRVAGTATGKYVEARNLAIRLLRKKIFCTNSFGYLNWPRMGKISQHGVFVENDISVIPTKVLYTKEQILNENWTFPVICKFERGYQGKSVRKFDNFKDLSDWVKRKDEKVLGMYLWQKCIPNTWDIRVIVLDGKTLGSMKRSANGDEFRSNFSLGGNVEKWDLSDCDKKLAEKVALVCGLDYCGVDIIKDNDGQSYILEVNRQCQFQGFEKSTGINVGKAVVEMLLKRQF
jgi:RimK family alpha-L-glutamate ligase